MFDKEEESATNGGGGLALFVVRCRDGGTVAFRRAITTDRM